MKKTTGKRPAQPRRRQPAAPMPHADLARWYHRKLARMYPQATCALHHRNAYELLIATILSAQCTDARVNRVTPALFARYPDPAAMAQAQPAELEKLIRSTGFFRNKAKSILGACGLIVRQFAGQVPATMDELLELPGVARKTANVVLGNAFGINAGVVVDTHVSRLTQRMGLTNQTDPVKIERELMELFPRKDWAILAHRLIAHGRQVCAARKPACARCALAERCPRIGLE